MEGGCQPVDIQSATWPFSLRRAPVEDGAAPLARSVEHGHCPQAVSHLLREPALDPSGLRKLGGVEELGQREREQRRGVGGRGEQATLLDGDQPAAGHDPAPPTERLPGTVDAELVLVGEDDLELEPGQAEERGDADEPAEDVLDTAAAGRAASGEDIALVREPDNPAPDGHRRDKPHRMVLREQLELAPQGREATGLDLDQQVAANEIDDKTAGDLLEQVAGTAVPLLQLRVKRALVERPDLHDNTPSAPPPPCLRPRLTPTPAAGTVTQCERSSCFGTGSRAGRIRQLPTSTARSRREANARRGGSPSTCVGRGSAPRSSSALLRFALARRSRRSS